MPIANQTISQPKRAACPPTKAALASAGAIARSHKGFHSPPASDCTT